mmetsp:Transcript_10265/g.23810  ORF Transcript_10265/g.23810 Transcript_10265/m.23810 type:complete len:223 (-) Transcript_10265:80-748(-)
MSASIAQVLVIVRSARSRRPFEISRSSADTFSPATSSISCSRALFSLASSYSSLRISPSVASSSAAARITVSESTGSLKVSANSTLISARRASSFSVSNSSAQESMIASSSASSSTNSCRSSSFSARSTATSSTSSASESPSESTREARVLSNVESFSFLIGGAPAESARVYADASPAVASGCGCVPPATPDPLAPTPPSAARKSAACLVALDSKAARIASS